VILDTSVLIDWERRQADLAAFVEGRRGEPFGLSVITAAELLNGVHRANTPARRLKRSAYVEQVLSLFPLYDLDLPVARAYAELWAVVQAKGKPTSAHDLVIAATALSRGFSVATFDLRDYRKIEGLTLEVIRRPHG
jgi:predicted nucleic acid-binding protein